jgi:hypothetical protein
LKKKNSQQEKENPKLFEKGAMLDKAQHLTSDYNNNPFI